jgi:hypothetical protein
MLSSSVQSNGLSPEIMAFLPLTPPINTPNTQLVGLTKFLVLAPVSSDTYPMSHPPAASTRAASALAQVAPAPAKDLAAAPLVEATPKGRRSSSSSISSAESVRLRFLKLGPVFGGGDPSVGDYADEE